MSDRSPRYRLCRHVSVLAVTCLFLYGPSFSLHGSARAQLPDTLSSQTHLSLLTIYPGGAIYSAFGHSTFRFYDPVTGYDIVFNYGMFDASDPFFIPRFMYGKLDYLLDFGSMRSLLRGAEIERRSVIEQSLGIPPEMIAELYQNLLVNARPENRAYLYDFLFENCATILLDRIQDTKQTALLLDSTGVQVKTFRELLQPYLNHRPLYDLGIAIVLGSTLDRASTYEERSFLPLELMEAFGRASIKLPDDGSAALDFSPLVTSTDTLYWVPGSSLSSVRDRTLLWILTVLGILWIVGRELLLRRRKSGLHVKEKIGDRPDPISLDDRVFFGVLGLAGLIISFVWFVSAHTVGSANWNILWALPTHIVPALFSNRISVGWRKRYFAVTCILALGLLLMQPLLAQSLHPALIPLVVVVAWRSFALFRDARMRSSGKTT